MYKIEVYGHRGARALLPENTLPAFIFAAQNGVDYVDMDLVVTQDGVIVTSHDLWLNEDIIVKDATGVFITRGESKRVRDLTFAQLAEFSVALNHNTSYAKFFPQQRQLANTKIPSLNQVVTCLEQITKQQIKYQFEIKTEQTNPQDSFSTNELAWLIHNFIIDYKLLDRVEVQAFNWQILFALQALNHNIKTAYLLSKQNIASMYQDDCELANKLHGGYLLKQFDYNIALMVKSLGGSCYDPEDTGLTQNDLLMAHDLGLKVVVWRYPEVSGSIYDQQLITKLVSWGVDGIIVDDPLKLINDLVSI